MEPRQEARRDRDGAYVYVENRHDLDAVFDHIMAPVARAALPGGDWRQRLSWLLLKAIATASGHGAMAGVALTGIPSGPNATLITERVRDLLTEGGLPEQTVPAALDLLALFVTAAALDRVPTTTATPRQHQRLLRRETDVTLNGLIATDQPGGAASLAYPAAHRGAAR